MPYIGRFYCWKRTKNEVLRTYSGRSGSATVPWTLSRTARLGVDGSESMIILTNPEEAEFTYAMEDKKKARAVRRKAAVCQGSMKPLYKKSFLDMAPILALPGEIISVNGKQPTVHMIQGQVTGKQPFSLTYWHGCSHPGGDRRKKGDSSQQFRQEANDIEIDGKILQIKSPRHQVYKLGDWSTDQLKLVMPGRMGNLD
ncbi:hypothetical protein Tco_1203545 [Tanacetum coccineum]